MSVWYYAMDQIRIVETHTTHTQTPRSHDRSEGVCLFLEWKTMRRENVALAGFRRTKKKKNKRFGLDVFASQNHSR